MMMTKLRMRTGSVLEMLAHPNIATSEQRLIMTNDNDDDDDDDDDDGDNDNNDDNVVADGTKGSFWTR